LANKAYKKQRDNYRCHKSKKIQVVIFAPESVSWQ